jgi:hypothetical protein
MSSSELVHKLVHRPSAEHSATPVPILQVSSCPSDQLMQLLVIVQTALAAGIASKAAVYNVLTAYDIFVAACESVTRIPDGSDLLVPGRSSSPKALVCIQYGWYCSHHDDTTTIVPCQMNSNVTSHFRGPQSP